MSSTNRGYARHESDYYITPQKDIFHFLTHFLQDNEWQDLSEQVILDPCCGGDENHVSSYMNQLKRFSPKKLIGLDIREDARSDIQCDFLETTKETFENQLFDMIISNPPFYLALEFVKKSLELVKDDGYVIMLLRLNFMGTKKRYPFFKQHMPERTYVHHARISFSESGKTDSIEYAHFVWKKGFNNNFSKLYVI